MQIKLFPEKLTRADTDKLLIQANDDNYYYLNVGNLFTGIGSGSSWAYTNTDLSLIAFPNRLIVDSSSEVSVQLPTNPVSGGEIEIKTQNSAGAIRLSNVGKINSLSPTGNDKAYLKYSTNSTKLIYVNPSVGWITIPDSQVVVRGDLVLPSTGLQHRLFAGDIEGIADNASMSQWSDTSGNSRHGIQATTSAQPQYRKSIFSNILPSVFFSGSQFFGTDLSYIANQKYLIAVVEARTASGNIFLFGQDNSTSNASLHVGWRTGTSFTLGQFANDLNATGLADYQNLSPNIWILSNGATGKQIWRNGFLLSSNTNTTNLSSGINGRIGKAVNTIFFTGHIGLIAVYTGASLPDISSLFTAINKHYGIY
jgi:hypothetical protein